MLMCFENDVVPVTASCELDVDVYVGLCQSQQPRLPKPQECTTYNFIMAQSLLYLTANETYVIRNMRHTFKLPVHVQKQDRKQKLLRCCTEQFRTKG